MDLTDLPQASTYRLVAFDQAGLRPGSTGDAYVLVVSGTKPYRNVAVELAPQPSIDDPGGSRPAYWGIEVVGKFSGLLLPSPTPYEASLELDAMNGPVGLGGVEVIGANKHQRIPIPPD